jgi:hypothetical protein
MCFSTVNYSVLIRDTVVVSLLVVAIYDSLIREIDLPI